MICNKKKGFTLAESLIFLLVTALVLAATMPIVTRKHLRPGQKVPHGKWACKLINGRMMSATAGSANAELPPDEYWKAGCEFPEIPSSVKYLIVRVIGAGAAGGSGYISLAQQQNFDTIFKTFEDSKAPIPVEARASEPFIVKSTGIYRVRMEGDNGGPAKLLPNRLEHSLFGSKFGEGCVFDPAPAREDVPIVEFDYELQHGDVLTLHEDCSLDEIENKYNSLNELTLLCNPDTEYEVKYTDQNGKEESGVFKFKPPVSHTPGYNGCKRTLYLNRGNDAKKLATVAGGGGGFYFSNADACTIECDIRYQPATDRAETVYAKPQEHITVDSKAENVIYSIGVPKGIGILTKSITIEAYGGCGGASGQANTVLMLRPEDGEVPTFSLGRYDGTTESQRATTFNHIVAAGAIRGQCSSQGVSNTYSGRQGSSAADLDSIGGSGGKGGLNKNTLLKDALDSSIFDLIKIGASSADQVKYNACILTAPNQSVAEDCKGKSVSIRGGKAVGIGAGGGGGGVILALDVQDKGEQETLMEFLKSADFTKYKDISFVGQGGEGSSGGIVVSW